MNDMKRDELLSSGAVLSGNKDWCRADARMSTKELPGFTSKLSVGGQDLYVQTGWLDGRIVWIDITLSRGGKDTPEIDTARFDLARGALEDICKRASEMLQTNTVGIGHFVRDWRGRKMYPDGVYPQLQCVVNGPTDAVARLIERDIVDWTKRIVEQEALKKDAVADS